MRRTVAVLLIALSALIGLPGTAHAGGPTSVLISEPGAEQSAALYYTSADYADLERILNEPTKTQGLPPGFQNADYYNVTWMIHDVQPWRVDTVYITDGGAAYVTTRLMDEVESEGVQSKGRQVANSDELVALLDRVFAGKASTQGATQPVIQQEPAAAPPGTETTRWFSLTGWRWVAPGLLGGLLVGFMVSRQRAPAEPRRTLIEHGVTT